ncbi:hypothetical protein BG003_008664 [Podila horticola]|nr:hypothetical protein BG003_008664 [Podila horticola]
MSAENHPTDPATGAHMTETILKEDHQPDVLFILEEKTSTVTFDSGNFFRQCDLNSATEGTHLEAHGMVRYKVEMECHQFLEHRCSSDNSNSSNRLLQQVRVGNARLPIEVRCFIGESRTEVEVPQAGYSIIVHFPPVYSNFRTSVAKIYFDSNALPSIDPRVPHSILLLLRLDIILDAECSAHLPTLCLPQTPANASALAELEEAQERFFDPLMATLAHTVLAQDYPLVFSAAKIKNFVWVLEWVQVTVDSLHNVYRRASCPREKARMTSYIQLLQSRYPTIPSDDVRLLLEHVFTCHAYSEVLGRRQHGSGKRTTKFVMNPSSGVDPVEPAVLGEFREFRELDEDEETAFGEIKDDDDDFWDEACELEGDMEDMAEVWAGLDSPDEEESWSDILQD